MSMQLSKETTEESIRVFLDQIKILRGQTVSRDMQIEWLQKENMRLREVLRYIDSKIFVNSHGYFDLKADFDYPTLSNEIEDKSDE